MNHKTTTAFLAIIIPTLFMGQATTELRKNELSDKYSNTITAEELSEHLHIISADEYAGRETGMIGQKKCEAYLINEFQKLGIPPVNNSYTQEFTLSLKDPANVTLNINDKEYGFLQDYFYYPGAADGTYDLDLVFLGYGIEDPAYTDYIGVDVRGKAIIMLSGEPIDKGGISRITGTKEMSDWTKETNKKLDLAKKKGVGAVFIVNPEFEERVKKAGHYFGRKSMGLKKDEEKSQKEDNPVYYISEKMATEALADGKIKLAKAKKKMNTKGVAQSKPAGKSTMVFNRNSGELISSNVLGYIEGSDLKNELIVITAHYDHIGVEGEDVYNGADDDGSGTVTLLEIAEAFMQAKNEGHGPRRSVLIMPVSGEEKGLLGSEYYTDHPIFPLENTVANLNIDMIGRIDEHHPDNENYVYLIGADRLSTDLHEISEQCNQTYTQLELDYTYNAEDDPNRFYYRSDHYNFAKNNIPVIFYFTGVHEDYHKPTDTVDKILFDKLGKIGRLVFHTAWELANRDERIVVDKPMEAK